MIYLKHYGVYEVQGDNALQFLQGQITNDILGLVEEQVVPALLCNVQGRILLMLYILKKNDTIFVLLRKDMQAIFQTSLAKVAALSKVKFFSRDDLVVLYDHKFILSEDLIENHDDKQWLINRIKHNEFDIHPATSGLFLPQDLGLEEKWVSFTKGCYRGQEIIARMHYLGKSKYHLVYSKSNDMSLKPGDKIDSNTTVVDMVEAKDHLHLLLCAKI